MIGDVFYLPDICSGIFLAVIHEEYGVSTCRIISNRSAGMDKTGDFYIYFKTGQHINTGWLSDPIRLVFGDFMIDAYTSSLGERIATMDPENLALLSGGSEDDLRIVMHRRIGPRRNEITTLLWKTFTVPVIRGGVIR